MRLNTLTLVLLCTINCSINQANAQVIKCIYNYNYHVNLGYKTTNDSYYDCRLDTSFADYNENIIRINGEHLRRFSDNDVQWIGAISSGTILKTFSAIFCQKYPNLEEIDLNSAEIQSIDEDSLSNCRNLTRLQLNSNKIQEVLEHLLSKNTKLTKIKLNQNELTALPEDLFLNQKELEELYLYSNKLSSLPNSIFDSLEKLEVLSLNENQLEILDPKWFENLGNLRRLSLYGNKITEVPSNSFKSLKNLEYLWIMENKLKTLNSDSFDGLENLQVLNLRTNELSNLPPYVFAPLKNLQELYLNYNKLTTIHSDSFDTHDKLKEFYLQGNKINAVDEQLIDKIDIPLLDMTSNVCSQMLMTTWSDIKLNLKKCFDNYEPRIQSKMDIDFVFPYYRTLILTTRPNSCGKSTAGVGNIIGGSFISRGKFPWIAALIMPTGDYFCGGTLITSRKVLTAAHCIQEKQANRPKYAGEFLVLLGVHDLKKFIEIGRVPYAVQRVNTHPDWNPLVLSFDADIAVLVLDREVTFSEYIQPICLTSLQVPTVATTGVVVGYGKSQDTTKIHENIPKAIETPIHSNEHCFLKNINLVKISSQRTFCGGSGTGVGVCRGDSGSGLFVTDGSAYYLRGIVSSSIIGGPYGCDVDTYSVFTDVTKYVDWINESAN